MLILARLKAADECGCGAAGEGGTHTFITSALCFMIFVGLLLRKQEFKTS